METKMGWTMVATFALAMQTESADVKVSPCREYVNHAFRAPAVKAGEKVAGFVWLEAEYFAGYGGWKVDTQFTHKMGSAYLLAPGVLEPVAPATTKVRIPRQGTWRAWVRTKDWLPEFSPGTFVLEVAGKRSRVLGASRREGWAWENAGDFALNAGENTVSLVDLSGALSRCDAILFTTDLSYVPPEEASALAAERRRLTTGEVNVADGGAFDLVVVGAGPGGLGAAFAAARNGLRVAVVHDRPVLGGNANCEMEVGINGAGGAKGRESGLVCEALMRCKMHEGWSYSDAFREMADELKGRFFEFPNERVMSAEKNGDAIASVVSRNTLTGKETRFAGRYFADGTGDGWLGLFAGAEYMHGREGKNEYNEAPAPVRRDEITMSGCVMKDRRVGYIVGYADHPVPYRTPAWANVLPKGFRRRVHGPHGAWWMENNGRFNDLEDPERARDQLVRISYAYWGWIKNESPVKEQAKNAYMAEIAWKNARREGYRLVGDYVMTANDALAGTMFPDRISYGGWGLDTHDPLGMENPTGNGFWRSHPGVPLYSIPYRCIYSKNVSNLFLCGRSISVTHIAFGTIRVMATLFQLGQAAGTAAAVACEKGGITPRECGKRHIKEIQQRLLKDDHYIPQIQNEDPFDLARTAKVSSSDAGLRRLTFGASAPGLRSKDGMAHDCSGFRRAVRFERGSLKTLDAVSLLLVNNGKKPVVTTVNVFLTDSQSWRPDDRPAAVLKATVPAGHDGLVRFAPERPVAVGAKFVWLEVVPVKGISWALREGTTGYSDFRAYCAKGQERWTAIDGQQYSFVTEPALVRESDSNAAAVVDGVARLEDGVYHGWRSNPGAKLPQSIRLDFPAPVTVREVRITFDPKLSSARQYARPKELVKAYEVEGLSDGKWMRLAGDGNNQLRHRVHTFPAVKIGALRVTVKETWGDKSARIFEIRAYENVATFSRDAGDIRLMSYNIHHCRGADLKVDCRRIAEVIDRERPDFVGLNEVDQVAARSGNIDIPAELARMTGLHATFAKAISLRDGGDYGNAILSREKPLSVRRVPLPGGEPRVLLLCEFKDFWFGTAHFALQATNRLATAKIIKDVLPKTCGGKPVFLSGDWNATPDSQTLETMRGFLTVLTDVDKRTFHGFAKRYPATIFCIDYIAVDKESAKRFRVKETHATPETMASDHNPVILTLERAP